MSEAMLLRTEPIYSLTLWLGGSYSDSLLKRFKKGRNTNLNCNQTGLMLYTEAVSSSF